MRALILGLSVVILGFVAAIVLEVTSRARPSRQAGDEFQVGRLLADALPGEAAAYREEGGRSRLRTFVVEGVIPPESGQGNVPVVNILQTTADPRLAPERAQKLSYGHRITDHFWFPLTMPSAPRAFNRIWILQRIRRVTLLHEGHPRRCWRIDLIDPALPEASEHVVAWLDPEVPVFGLLRWKRANETWVLESAKGVQ